MTFHSVRCFHSLFGISIALLTVAALAKEKFSSRDELIRALKKYLEAVEATAKDRAVAKSIVDVYGPIRNWDVSGVEDLSFLFMNDRIRPRFNEDISGWNTTGVKYMKNMFKNAETFDQPLYDWDVSSVTNMNGMFYLARSFNKPLNGWDVSNTRDMKFMFSGARSFNRPLDSWDVSSVTAMDSMFMGAIAFNQRLDEWDVSGVRSMENMFAGAELFNQPLNGWDVSSVTSTASMFRVARVFNQPLDGWDVPSVISMEGMFSHARVFNQPLEHWDVSSVVDMARMFQGARAFNQDLCSWRDAIDMYEAPPSMVHMFDGSSCPHEETPTEENNVFCWQNCGGTARNAEQDDGRLNPWIVSFVLAAAVVGGLDYWRANDRRNRHYYSRIFPESNAQSLYAEDTSSNRSDDDDGRGLELT